MSSFVWPELAKKYDSAEEVAEILIELQKNSKECKSIKLSGNSFNLAAVQAISDVLKPLSVLGSADLSDVFTGKLKDEVPAMVELFSSALSNTPLTTLHFSDNALGAVGLKAILPHLLLKPTFTCLHVDNCGLGNEGMLVLQEFLEGTTFSPDHHNSSSDPVGEITSSLESLSLSGKIKLQKFYVARNRLNSKGAITLSRSIPFFSDLREFKVYGNSIGEDGMEALCQALIHCPALEVLDLSDNNCKQKGGEALVTLLSHLSSTLRSLNIGDSSLSSAHTKIILSNLSIGFDKLEELDVSYLEINSSVIDVVVTIIQSKKNFKKLEINGNQLNKESISQIKEALTEKSAQIGSLEDNENESDEEEADDE